MKIEENQQEALDNLTISKEYGLDLEKLYFTYINEIDSYRSYTLVDSSVRLNNSTPQISQSPQESRCHAFYRMIGFPAVASLDVFYSPGFANNLSNIDNNRREIAYSEAKRDNILSIFLAREQYVKNILSMFSKKDSTSAYLASAILYHIDLNSILNNTAPFDIDLKSYNRKSESVYSKLYGETDFTKSTYIASRPHFIRPFAVSPVIEKNVKPGSKMLGIPFVKGGEQYDASITVKKSLIEKVIYERMLYSKTDIKKLTESKDQQLNEQINKINTILDSFKNNKYINYNKYVTSIIIIHKLMDTLFESRKQIEKVRSKYNWLPMPVEGGFDKGVTTYDNLDKSFSTEADKEIEQLQYKLFIYELEIQTKQKEDPANYVFASVEEANIVADAELNSKSPNLQLNLQELTNDRDQAYKEANTALVDIERIIGEFSGLGLLDILVIINSLYIVDIDVLIGLLDSTSLEAMQKDKELKTLIESVEKMTVGTAIMKFEEKVREFYSIANSYYKFISEDKATK
jgi:hypothetical protein